jgi:hypothetical protein
MPINYATAAIPTYAPFGTEYTPLQSIKIVGGRCIVIPQSIANIPKFPSEPITKTPYVSVFFSLHIQSCTAKAEGGGRRVHPPINENFGIFSYGNRP